MATKLCCTAEQDDRSDSPELPNARVSQPTPVNRPLLAKDASSPNSRFTSARSEDLHELHEIFHNARDSNEDRAMPMRTLRTRFSRPSMHSIRSLHKMTSMRSLIRRKFSKELPKKAPTVSSPHLQPRPRNITPAAGTVVKQLKDGTNQQLQITKDDLRKDLLSDKKPDEGGYDSDAEALDEIANNIGKKSPIKRASIHSIDWTTTTGSKTTPDSSKRDRISGELNDDLPPYSIDKPHAGPFSHRFSQVFSTPNLRSDTPGGKDNRVRRSHSATSMGLPKPSPLSPLRLPSLTDHDSAGIPWAEVMHKSLRLSQFPVPPRHISPQASVTTFKNDGHKRHQKRSSSASVSSHRALGPTASPCGRLIEIRVQQPTSTATPRPSTSIRGTLRGDSPRKARGGAHNGEDDDDDDNPRRSVHLYSMRISHHLRSGSLLSWDQLADAPELPTPPRAFRERTVSDQSRTSPRSKQLARHDRQTSSSGFASSKVPSRWGKVLPNDLDTRPDVASSIYSSRPQSPPDSFGGSVTTLPRTDTENRPVSISSADIRRPRRSASFPTDNEDTPRPAKRHGLTNLATVTGHPIEPSLLAPPAPLARKNSVADTKTSKFREEFSPSPPKKKMTQSASIIKFLNPKRLSLRSQSEANLQSEASASSTVALAAVDGPSDTLELPVNHGRRQSRSLISMQAEQDALGKNKGANHVWDRALQAHQDEKASLYLPKNRDLAVHASPFRERSGSVSVRRISVEGLDPASRADDGSSTRVSTLDPHAETPGEERSEGLFKMVSRRSAMVGRDDVSVGQEVANAFERQGDSTDVVGAWGRYPSHTRHDRTASAGKADNVQPRDFALEAAIKFASATDDEDLIDPTARRPSTPLLPGEKKKKKKVGSGRVAKSNSMTFGKTLMKNYTKMFRSQSTEFRRHGRGHRSSIASGGILEHPELELLPDVWAGEVHRDVDTYIPGDEQSVLRQETLKKTTKSRSNLRAEDSMATLRPRRNSSAPNLNEMSFGDGAADAQHANDRARVWSTYYENCVDAYPRLSIDTNRVLQDFGRPNRHSFDSRQVSVHSRTLPTHLRKHTRNASQMSQMSSGSRARSFGSLGQDDSAFEERSLVSVRRSTMDLISKFKQQEATEHERILSFSRMDSGKARESVAAQ
ncbi:uncharacterized protein J4E87_003302 [Alternaria ethzedia]|uniref:uncharacterized protein n=1 Tax=Alternaria ethzedia TaxID=181014 RepID=UPI0020C56842|nr:uncharacterized protein J4E87_003302 [Alternaria ethzedia]KAI4629042.1 hypothetical protein J4E87_003302 [Alternaria ethzedia]